MRILSLFAFLVAACVRGEAGNPEGVSIKQDRAFGDIAYEYISDGSYYATIYYMETEISAFLDVLDLYIEQAPVKFSREQAIQIDKIAPRSRVRSSLIFYNNLHHPGPGAAGYGEYMGGGLFCFPHSVGQMGKIYRTVKYIDGGGVFVRHDEACADFEVSGEVVRLVGKNIDDDYR